MTTHYHLLIVTPHADLAAGMHRLNWRYARSFNERHEARGHVFDSRYTSELVQTESHARNIARYIALNPVEAGVCRYPSEWRWSSYNATVGIASPPPWLDVEWLLRLFGDDREHSRSEFASYVEERRLELLGSPELRLAA